MGEIGRDRHEYLYEMRYWEILLIIRGYRRRNVLQYQFQRLQAFHSLFAMRENKQGKTPDQLWPCYFDNYITDEQEPPITDEDAKELLDLMTTINTQQQGSGK